MIVKLLIKLWGSFVVFSLTINIKSQLVGLNLGIMVKAGLSVDPDNALFERKILKVFSVFFL